MKHNKRSTTEIVIMVMGVIALGATLLFGYLAFPISFSVCGIIGLFYGIKSKNKTFIRWSSLSLLIGVAMVTYTLLLIHSM